MNPKTESNFGIKTKNRGRKMARLSVISLFAVVLVALSLAVPRVSEAAVAHVGTVGTTFTTATYSPIATLPTGVQTGHLLLAWVVTNNLSSLNSTSGWTQIGVSRTQDSGVTNDSTIHLLYRDGLEGFSWTFTDLFNNTETGVIVISAWSGVNTSSPINTYASAAGSALSTSVSGPSITPTLANCMIVQLLGCDPSASTYSGTPDTSPVGTEIYDLADAGTYAYAAIQYYLQGAAAAIALDYTALTSDYYGRFQVALNEAIGSAPAAPVANAATNIQGASFSANWNASTGATGYRLDVATDSSFTSFLTGYNNLDVGNVLTYSVSCSPNTTYYYRVRAYSAGGTSGNSNTITLTTLGGLTLANHTLGQVGDAFTTTTPVTAVLFRFNLTRIGTVTVTNLRVNFTTTGGVVTADVTSGALYQDNNNDGAVDGGDTAIQTGVTPSGGVLTFTTDFTPGTSGTNYLVRATVSNLVAGDTTTFSLNTGGIDETPTGVAESGSISSATHTQDLLLTLADHTLGQVADKFNTTSPVTDVLFRFKLTSAGTVTVTNLRVNFTTTGGVADGDVTNGRLYVDFNNDGAVDGGDILIQTGVAPSGGVLTFTTDFTPGTSGTNYLVQATISNLGGGDTTTFSVTAVGIDETQTGVVESGSISSATHTEDTVPTNLTQAHYRWRNNDGNEAGISETGSATITGNSTTVSITHALTINANDVIVAVIHGNLNGLNFVDNNGAYPFTEQFEETNPATGATSTYAIYYRVAGASEPSSYSWTLGVTPYAWSIQIRVFSGVNPSSVWDVAPSASTRSYSTVDGTTATAPTMTTSSDGAMGILLVVSDSSTVTFTNPTNSYGMEVEPANNRAQASFIRTWATAGATGASSATLSASNDWVAHQFALRSLGIATWSADEDTKLTGLAKSTPKRVRFEVSNEGTLTSGGVPYQLQVAQTSTCGSGTYLPVPTDTSGHWQIVDSTYVITDGEATSNIDPGLTDEATTFVPGQLKDADNTTGSITLNGDQFTEIEFAVQATTNATDGGDYCFKLVKAGIGNLDNYSHYAEVALAGIAATTTLGDGTDPSNSTVAPGSTGQYLDQFTFVTSTGTDSITGLTVTTANTTAVASMAVWNDALTIQYFSTVSTPAGNAWSFSGGTPIPVTSTSTAFRIWFTAKNHAALSEGTYAVTGTVTSFTSTNSQVGTDADSATVTVDNTPPANATWGTITPGDGQVELNWSNPGDADFNKVVILRRAGAAVGDAPAEGSEYSVGNTIGSSIVRYVGSLATFTDTGLTGGTSYYYKLFAYDTYINYSSGAGTGPHTPAAGAAYSYRKAITVGGQIGGSCGADLSNFPVLISISGDNDLKTSPIGHVQNSNGYDIIFKDASGTQLDHEVESYSGTTGTLVAWVRIPTLDYNGDTIIYMYYGNSSISSSTENATGVWNSNYAVVQHMHGGSYTELDDSTSNNNDVTTEVSDPVYQATGKIGYSAEFDGNDALMIQDSASLDITNQVTLSAWIRPTATGMWNRIVAKSHTTDVQPHTMYGLMFDDTNHLREEIASGNVQNGANGTSTVPTDGSWTYATVTYDHTALRVYFNGVAQGTPTSLTTNIDLNDMPLSVARSGYDSDYFTGRIDEVRVSNIARDACWIETEFNNQNTPSIFYEVGSEEPLNFNYYKPLTIQSSMISASCGADLTNFPVLVSITGDNDLKTAPTGHVQSSSGYDIIFKDANGVKLDHEIERYDGTAGTLVAWVRIPTLDYNGNTVINMYYGNSAVTSSTENRTGVWNTNYVGVWHLSESPNDGVAGHVDSTGKNVAGTPQNFQDGGGGTTNATGKIGGADYFAGDDDYVDCGNNSVLNVNYATVELWLNVNSWVVDGGILAKGNDTYRQYWMWTYNSAVSMEVDEGTLQNNAWAPSLGAWQHLVLTYDGSNVTTYRNGIQENQYPQTTGAIDGTAQPLLFGSIPSYSYFNGSLDEVRISNIARDLCWIQTEYNNQNAPGTYVQPGTEVVITDVSLANHAAGQETDKFTSGSSVTGAELFAFKLTNNLASGVTVNQVQFQLSSVTGIAQGDFANLAIYVDANNDGTIGGGETTTVGGTGVVNSGPTTITFSTDFNISASATVNYILKGDVSNLVAGDTVTIALGMSNVTLISGTVGGSSATNVTHTADSAGGLTQIHYRWRNDDGAEQGSANWWNTSYLYRRKVTFGTSHSLLPLYYTVTATMDTRPANTNVELTTGNDVRVVWQPTAGGATELDRIGSTWDSATTNIDFRLQSEIGANLNEDPDGTYYIYYGNASAGTPPTNEMNVYYFADFFNRTDSTTVGNGWQEWNDAVLSDMYLQTNALYSKGNNIGPPDAGVKQAFALGAIPGDFTLSFDVTIQTNVEATWTHYVNVGNSGTMVDSSRTTGVGPGIYFGEGAHFVPDSLNYNISNDLTGNMETGITGPQSIRMVVNRTGQTYDYYRGGTLRASGQTYVTSQATLNQIRIANDQYSNTEAAFIYDNVKIVLNVASTPAPAAGTEEAYQASGATWAAAEDTKLVGLAKDTIKRIRFEISNEGASTSGAVTYQLQVAQTSTCGSGTYSAVPTDTSGHWQITDSTYITDGQATQNISGLTDEATTFVPGQMKDAGNTTGSITLAADQFTELEFAVKAISNAIENADYCFRLVAASGTSVSTYMVYGQVSIAGPNLTQIHYRWRNDDGSEGGFDKGTGADGALAPTGTFNLNTSTSGGRSYADGIAYRIDASTMTGNSVTRYSGSVTLSNGIAAGDEVILINLQGGSGDTADVGNYEFLRVQSATASTVTFTTNITKSYDGTTPANQKVLIQRVPNYTSVTLDSTDTLTASAWDGLATTPTGAAGYYSGLVAFRATGTVSVGATASISASGLGYRLGNGVPGDNQYGYQAESYTGNPGAMTPTVNGGGGGGGDLTNVGVDSCGEGGGGGGYGTVGTAGGYGSLCGGSLPMNNGGATYGIADLSKIYLGSGGGGGASDEHSTVNSGAGARGAGIVMIFADTITVSGTLRANGADAPSTPAGGDNGMGGGGSGGSIYLAANTATLGSNLVTASGGAGGPNIADPTWIGAGGTGGSGRIRVEANTKSGTTSPTYSGAGTPGGTGASWAANEDTKLNEAIPGKIYRLRFEVSNEGAIGSGAVTYKLQVALTDTCGSGAYTDVLTDTSGHFQIINSSYLTDAGATTDVTNGLTNESTTFVPGQVKDTGNTTGSITLNTNQFTELEFAVQATDNSVLGANYCFRLYRASSSAELNTYSVYGQIGLSACQYLYRKPLTIDFTRLGASCGTSGVTEFPVLISMSGVDDIKTTANGGHVQSSNGYDIIFRASNGVDELWHEIESYDGSGAGTPAGISFVRSGGISDGIGFSFDIGSAGTNRLVLVIAGNESTGTNLSGVVVDGKACNLIARADNPNGAGNHQEMWYCDEDDLGASNGVVTVAIAGGGATWGVQAHLYTGVSQSGPTDYGVDQTSLNLTTVTVTGIDVPANGLVVMGAGEGTDFYNINSWTSPLTERQSEPGHPTSADLISASGIETSVQTNKTYVATFSGTFNRGTAIVASFAEAPGASGGGKLVAWVRVPVISGTADTTIYMYYGNACILSATQSPTNVWDTNYTGVWHLKESGDNVGYDYQDSTLNANHGQGGGGTAGRVPAQIAGKISSGQDFNRANTQFISIPNAASLQITGTITLEAWGYADSFLAGWQFPNLVARQYGTGAGDAYTLSVGNGTASSAPVYGWFSGSVNSTSNISSGAWYHLAVTVNSSGNAYVYVNGAQAGSATGITIPTDTNPTLIGGQENDGTTTPTADSLWDGIIDEVRISNIVRPQCYIQTEYNNMNWPNKTESGANGFVTIGAEQGASYPTAVSLVSFKATGDGGNVLVSWTTAQEINNFGFHVYRSERVGGPYTRITDRLIPGLTFSVRGRDYTYVDRNVTRGRLYYYKLEDIDMDGTRRMHGPVAVDWDGDGIPDDWEIRYGLNPAVDDSGLDPDGDGLTNIQEYSRGTDPLRADTDGDGVRDSQEYVGTVSPGLMRGVEVIASDATGMTLELRTDNFETVVLDEAGVSYRRLRVPEYLHGYTDTVGKPELPVKGILIDLPSGKGGTLSIESVESRELSNYWIYPVPEKVVSGEGDLATVSEVFAIDDAAYRVNSFYPDVVARVGETYDYRGQKKLQVFFNPFSFNPVTRELVQHTRIRVRVGYVALAETVPAVKAGVPVTPAPVPSLARSMVWVPPAPASAYKMLVSEEGIYRLTGAYLASQGVSVSDWSQVRVYHLGQEIPVYQGADYIEFYGTAPGEGYSKYTKSNVYWLTTSGGSGTPLRMGTIDGTPGTATIPSTHVFTVHAEEDTEYWGGILGAPSGPESLDRWVSSALTLGPGSEGSGPVDYPVTLPGVGGSRLGQVTVLLFGLSTLDHDVEIAVNGLSLGTYQWSGFEFYEVTVSDVPLAEGINTLRLTCLSGADPDNPDSVILDWVEVAYPRKYDASANVLKLTHNAGYKYQVGSFTSDSIQAYDITTPTDVKRLTNLQVTGSNPYTLTMEPRSGSGERTYLALSSAAVKTPVSFTKDVAGNLSGTSNGADYILITHRDLGWDGGGSARPWLTNLKSHREAQGLRVKVVDVEDVYDEFSYGIVSPQGIKDFLAYTYSNWVSPSPQYVLLVGDSLDDPKDNSGLGSINYVPAYLARTPFMPESLTDEWYVRISGNDTIADMDIGRLPASTTVQAETMVNKIITYETTPVLKTWERNTLLVADNQVEGYEVLFELMNEDVAGLLPTGMNAPFREYLNDYVNPNDLTLSMRNRLNVDGALILNYSGHGAVQLWANELIFSTGEVAALNNSGKLPFVVAMTCLNGSFGYPEAWAYPSLAEVLLRESNNGAVAAFMSTGMTEPEGQRVLDKALFEGIFRRDYRTLGRAISYAKQELVANSVALGETGKTFLLFGDPAMKLKVPLPTAPTAPTGQVSGSSVTLSWGASTDANGGAVAGYNVYRSTTPNGPYTKINSSLITNTQYADSTVQSGTYYYVIRSVDSDGYESASTLEMTVSVGARSVGGSGGSGGGGGGGGCFVSSIL